MSKKPVTRHPLSNNDEWFFSQHSVEIHAPIYRVKRKDTNTLNTNRKMVLQATNVCREGLMGGLCLGITDAIGTHRRDPKASWRMLYSRDFDVDLDRECLKQPEESWVAVHKAHIGANRMKDGYRHSGISVTADMVQDYLNVCDAVIGPITVLLNPDRYQGDWWRTTVEESRQNSGMLRWYGVDNTAVWHPALASLYTGLARQCAYMARAGVASQVLSDVEGRGLEECLTLSDDVLARKIVKRMQKWIAVPILKGGSTANIPVPLRSFSKISALHQAIYKHGFQKTFGKSFIQGWNSGTISHSMYAYATYRGIHSFMGPSGDNKQGQRIRELAKKKTV